MAPGIWSSAGAFNRSSAHLLAVTPTAHWLEYVDWADAIVEEPLRIVDGNAIAPARAGNGLTWNKEAVERYRMK